MAAGKNLQVVVRELPKDKLEASHFELREGEMPAPGDGEVLTRTLMLSLDAANRAWMQGRTYTDPVEAGAVMQGFTIAEVVDAKADGFKAGDIVETQNGWQQFAVQKPKALTRIAKMRGTLPEQMSVYGVTGLTAYFGLLDICDPKPDETLVVSAAAGAVGNVVCQIGKLKGARVVGIAGSDDKCRWLEESLNVDVGLNYKTAPVYKTLKGACPKGIDCYFDNVGGDTLEAVLFRMNLHGRISCCGVVSQYDTGNPAPGPRGVPGLLVTKRLRMEGFIVMDFYDRKEQALDEIAGWVKAGKLKSNTDVIDGLENAPKSLVGLLAGENTGKRMIRVAPDTA